MLTARVVPADTLTVVPDPALKVMLPALSVKATGVLMLILELLPMLKVVAALTVIPVGPVMFVTDLLFPE